MKSESINQASLKSFLVSKNARNDRPMIFRLIVSLRRKVCALLTLAILLQSLTFDSLLFPLLFVGLVKGQALKRYQTEVNRSAAAQKRAWIALEQSELRLMQQRMEGVFVLVRPLKEFLFE